MDKKLKIAIIAPPWLSLYPGCYYGIEIVVHNLAAALTKLGHHVELFTVAGSTTDATRRRWYHREDQYKHIHRPYYEVNSIPVSHVLYALNIIRRKGDFDIIHDHNSFIGPAILAYSTDLPPALHTLHEPFTDERKLASGIPDNREMFEQFHYIKNLYFNGVSKSQLKSAPPGLNRRILGVVHNAVDATEYTFSKKKDDYFLMAASMSPDKGQATAAKACRELNERLKLAGTIGGGISTKQQAMRALRTVSTEFRNDKFFLYFKNEVAPHLVPRKIEYIGKISGQAQKKMFSRAKALLFPIDWEEPFGMAVLDALASGTPVVAYKRGAMPEIISHGVNGFLAKDYDEFKMYMKRIDEINPEECRKSVDENFSTLIMAKNYLKLYRRVIKRYQA